MHESCSITQVERLELKASMIESDTDKLKGEVEPEALQGISSAAELTAFIGEVLVLFYTRIGSDRGNPKAQSCIVRGACYLCYHARCL